LKTIRRFAKWAILCAVIATCSTASLAESKGKNPKYVGTQITDRWVVRAGMFSAAFETEAAFAPTKLLGAIIRLESDLGLESQVDTAVVSGRYRFNERHQIGFSYTNLDRSSARVLDKDIEFGEYVFKAGSNLSTTFGTSMLRLKWKYNVAEGDRLAAGFGLGLSTFAIDLGLNGAIEVDDGGGGQILRTAEEGGDFIAPVPLVGMWIDYAIMPRLLVRASVEAVSFSISGNSGRVLDSAFLFEYYFTRLFGLGFGITSTDIEYGKDENNKFLRVKYRIDAFQTYLSFVF
jgi:hypothetical protein